MELFAIPFFSSDERTEHTQGRGPSKRLHGAHWQVNSLGQQGQDVEIHAATGRFVCRHWPVCAYRLV